MTVGCGNTLTHITPHKRLGQASSAQAKPGRVRHKTLIDLMDLCTVRTPSPNKQSAQDFSPSRQRGGARPSLDKATLYKRLRGQCRPAKLVNFTAGPRGRFERAVRRFIRAHTPILLPTPRSTRVDSSS